MYQWGLTDTLSAICTILYANLRFLTISCGIVRCWASTLRGRNNAQPQNTIVRSVQPDTLGFWHYLEKVAAAHSVVSGVVPLRSCEGPLLAQRGQSLNPLTSQAYVRNQPGQHCPPPSTRSTCPETNAPIGPANISTTRATSSTVAMRS